MCGIVGLYCKSPELEPRLGELHLRTLTILGFPALSRPGILDALNHQDFGYRWVTRGVRLEPARRRGP